MVLLVWIFDILVLRVDSKFVVLVDMIVVSIVVIASIGVFVVVVVVVGLFVEISLGLEVINVVWRVVWLLEL